MHLSCQGPLGHVGRDLPQSLLSPGKCWARVLKSLTLYDPAHRVSDVLGALATQRIMDRESWAHMEHGGHTNYGHIWVHRTTCIQGPQAYTKPWAHTNHEHMEPQAQTLGTYRTMGTHGITVTHRPRVHCSPEHIMDLQYTACGPTEAYG